MKILQSAWFVIQGSFAPKDRLLRRLALLRFSAPHLHQCAAALQGGIVLPAAFLLLSVHMVRIVLPVCRLGLPARLDSLVRLVRLSLHPAHYPGTRISLGMVQTIRALGRAALAISWTGLAALSALPTPGVSRGGCMPVLVTL